MQFFMNLLKNIKKNRTRNFQKISRVKNRTSGFFETVFIKFAHDRTMWKPIGSFRLFVLTMRSLLTLWFGQKFENLECLNL